MAALRRMHVLTRLLGLHHPKATTISGHQSMSQVQRKLLSNGELSEARIKVSPDQSQIDEKIKIKAWGLPPVSPVTLTVSVKVDEDKIHFKSTNFFMTTLEGTLDVENIPALPGGDYEGVDAMGPLISMRPVGDSGLALLPTDVTKGLACVIRVTLGHRHPEKEYKREAKLLAETVATRRYMAPGVQRIPVREGRVRGTLFVPPRSDPSQKFPLIVTLYGGINRGRTIEEKAACLASKGFVTLALAFFGVDDLPKRYDDRDVDIEYFEEAIDIAASREEVDSKRIGVFGLSKGGDLALSCVAFLKDKVKAGLILNACVSSVASSTVYKGKRVEALKWADFDNVQVRDDGSFDVSSSSPNPEDFPDSIIPFANSPAHLLFMAGTDDRNFHSVRFARLGKKLMEQAGKTNFEIVEYEGMGHMCNLPYSPAVFLFKHPIAPPGILLYMGGSDTKPQHLKCQKEAWDKTINFFKEKL